MSQRLVQISLLSLLLEETLGLAPLLLLGRLVQPLASLVDVIPHVIRILPLFISVLFFDRLHLLLPGEGLSVDELLLLWLRSLLFDILVNVFELGFELLG